MMDTNQALNRIEAILAGHRQPIRGRVMSSHFIYFRGCISPELWAEIELALGCKAEFGIVIVKS